MQGSIKIEAGEKKLADVNEEEKENYTERTDILRSRRSRQRRSRESTR